MARSLRYWRTRWFRRGIQLPFPRPGYLPRGAYHFLPRERTKGTQMSGRRRNVGFVGRQPIEVEEQLEDIVDDDVRFVGTPNVYDLEELMKTLQSKHPVDVYFLRKSLKWLMKRAYKDCDTVLSNPWWYPRRLK